METYSFSKSGKYFLLFVIFTFFPFNIHAQISYIGQYYENYNPAYEDYTGNDCANFGCQGWINYYSTWFGCDNSEYYGGFDNSDKQSLGWSTDNHGSIKNVDGLFNYHVFRHWTLGTMYKIRVYYPGAAVPTNVQLGDMVFNGVLDSDFRYGFDLRHVMTVYNFDSYGAMLGGHDNDRNKGRMITNPADPENEYGYSNPRPTGTILIIVSHKVGVVDEEDIEEAGSSLSATIVGPDTAIFGVNAHWTATALGGEGPFTCAWYRKNTGGGSWSSVGTSSSYTSNSHTVDFDLKVIVTDDNDSTAADSITVTVSYPPLDVEIDGMYLEHVVYDWSNSFWALVSGGLPDYSYEWYMEVDESEWELVCEDSIYSIETYDWEDLEELFPTLDIGSYLDLKLVVTDNVEESEYDIVYDLEVVEAQKKISSEQLPKDFKLEQNYPNPFNPVTTINFQLPKASNVTLVIYNIQGREVARLVDGYVQAGYHSITWDASTAASGIYIYRLQAGEFSDTKRMLLIK